MEPRETDHSIQAALEPHYVVFPSGQPRGRLFVFFHATTQYTDDYYLIADQAARNGFHVIGLRYFSQGGVVAEICRGDPSIDCAENVRREQQSGVDSSPRFSVSRANSVEGRLDSLLTHLHRRFPGEGWNRYLRAGEITWQDIVAAGHSQGASVAAFLAKEHRLARAVMFAGPVDSVQPQGRQTTAQPSPWLNGQYATPPDRCYAFGHAQDGQINLQAQWAAIKLGLERFGPPVNVDTEAAPYGGSHMLLTDAAAAPPKKPVVPNHGTTIRDDVTPKALDGQPVFAPVWQYMCFS